MTDARLLELLRSLRPGEALWLTAAGNSLWPLLKDGDALRVERAEEGALAPGEVALLEYPGTLVAHLVVGVKPLRTASAVGVPDPPPSAVLGRVVAFSRAGVTVKVPRWTAPVLRWVPGTARVAKRVPGAQRLVRWLRDS